MTDTASTTSHVVAAGLPGGACKRRAGAYDTACRCSPECIARQTRARRTRQRRFDAGIDGRVPCGRAQRAVRAYLADDPSRTLSDMGRLAGVSRRTLATIQAATPDKRILWTVAVKVIGVDPAVEQHGMRPVLGVQTRREVEALMAQGWPSTEVARRAGLSPATLSAQNLIPTCHASTADAVHEVFLNLRYKPGPSQQAVAKSRRLGHLPWSCWGAVHGRPGCTARPRRPGQGASRRVAGPGSRRRTLTCGSRRRRLTCL